MEFEREDLTPKPIIIFMIALVVGCILVALILRGMYSYLDASVNRHQPVLGPLAPRAGADTRTVSASDIAKFPQPRLESNERAEINDFRMQEEKELNSYGWVDQDAGVVHIPIERAMQLLAQRGLPTRPLTGSVPASEVSAAKEAARRPDASGMPAKRK